MSSLSNDLAAVVGADAVLDPAPSFYRSDATEAAGLEGTPDAVVLPWDSEAVAAVVAWCYERDIPIVPRGGGSGSAGRCRSRGAWWSTSREWCGCGASIRCCGESRSRPA